MKTFIMPTLQTEHLAKKILALVTHGVLSAGISNLKKNYSKLYLTNTIFQKASSTDITDLILKNILKRRKTDN